MLCLQCNEYITQSMIHIIKISMNMMMSELEVLTQVPNLLRTLIFTLLLVFFVFNKPFSFFRTYHMTLLCVCHTLGPRTHVDGFAG